MTEAAVEAERDGALESPPEYHVTGDDEGVGNFVKISKWWFFDRFGYKPHEVQLEFHKSLAQNRFWYGGKRLGKTTAMAWELAPILLTPGARIWIVSGRYGGCVRPYEELRDIITDVGIPPGSIKRAVCNPRQGDIELSLILEDPETGQRVLSQVIGKSAREVESLQSEALHAVAIDEANYIKEGVWTREIRPRLMTHGGISMAAAAPHGTSNWYHRTYLRWAAGQLDNYSFHGVGAHAGMNPHNAEAVIDEGEFLTEAEYRETVLGIPTPKAGSVFRKTPVFQDLHGRPPKGGTTYVGIDWGYVHPFAAVWVTVAPDEKGRECAYVWRTYRRTRRTVDRNVRALRTLNRRVEVDAFICDTADAASRAYLRELGWCVKKADKKVLAGIQDIERLIHDGRLVVDPERCRDLVSEMATMEWDSDAAGLPRDRPKKVDDDLVDALRYVVRKLTTWKMV